MQRYNLKPAAAWLRGHAIKTGVPEIDVELLEMPLEVLTEIFQQLELPLF